MVSTDHRIALECRPLRIAEAESSAAPPSLASLRWGLAMLFAGIMLTLGVTMSLPPSSTGPLLAPGIGDEAAVRETEGRPPLMPLPSSPRPTIP